MATRPSLKYDAVGDILYLEWCPPYIEQDSIMTATDVLYRRNPATKALERIEILSITRWTPADLAELSIDDEMRAILISLASYARAA